MCPPTGVGCLAQFALLVFPIGMEAGVCQGWLLYPQAWRISWGLYVCAGNPVTPASRRTLSGGLLFCIRLSLPVMPQPSRLVHRSVEDVVEEAIRQGLR
jgi:hypothetical protein